MKTAATKLRVEHLDEPFGIDVRVPRLSWQLPDGSRDQRAYRMQAGEWDSGRIESNEHVLVAYAGPALQSRARVEWRVKVWTDAGESQWSECSWWEMGLLGSDDWTARWIEPDEDAVGTPGLRPAQVLRTRFPVQRPVCRARIYATAHGIYELFCNGVRVGDLELTPGFTSYPKRLQVQAYDVSHLLVEGTNELHAVLSDGWFRGQVGYTREHDVYGTRLGLLAQLEVVLADGTSMTVGTDERWEHARGQILAADLIAGQRVDQRVVEDDLTFRPVQVVDRELTNLCASPAPPVRRIEIVRPRSVTRLEPDRHVVDLGQNINGWIRFAHHGARHAEVTLTYGEALDERGDVTMDHMAPVNWISQELLDPGQVDVVVSDGRGTVFEPRHTTHGFQYVRIEADTGAVAVDDTAGVVVHSDLRRTGWFACSDARINQLHEAAVWSFRTNACDIPTDCPQRERAGWTGDWQIFAPTAAFLFDVAGFTTKWLRDLAGDQRADGVVRNFAPDPAPPDADDNAIKTFLEGSSGWGDAAVLVPWAMWRAYGDRRLLEEQWPSMQAWVEFEARTARDGRHQSRIDRSPTPAPHEQYLWDTGFHWGEWTEPDVSGDHFADNLGNDFGIIATAYFERSTRTLARIAEILERTDDAPRYDELADHIREAWRTEFIAAPGQLTSERQADWVRALAFDLVAPEQRAQTAAGLVALIERAGMHLNTGFLATPFLLPVLADAGRLDVAYQLLFQDTSPSWLTMVDRGATTIWEHWDGIDGDGRAHASLNHYSKGAVVSFLHEHVAGIQIRDDGPGYRRFHVEPRPGGGITWADAAHESPYGRIESTWWLRRDELNLRVRVPPGTRATVRMPDGVVAEVGPGTASFRGPR